MAEITATLPKIERTAERKPLLVFLVQVSRPGLWTTTTLFYLMPLGHREFFVSGRFWLGLFFVLFPLGLLLYGVNDIVDAEGDLHNPRKGTFLFGSRGASEQLSALRWQIAVAVIPFAVVFFILLGPRILWWFAALLLAVGLYNAPRSSWKSHPPLDVLIQACYLLIFVLSSWVNETEQLPWPTFVLGALFAMHSHIFGEVMDIEPDRLSGRRTTATLIGRVKSKWIMAALLCAETALVLVFFRDWVIAGFLATGVVWFALDATVWWKENAYSPRTMRLFMWAWNATAAGGMYWNWTHGSLTRF